MKITISRKTGYARIRQADSPALPQDADPATKAAALDQFNTTLAKLMQKLKKDAGAASIAQNYKGTGSQKARRQLWVRFKSGAVIDLWLDMGWIQFGGVVTNRPPGSEKMLSMKRLPYENHTPEQIYEKAARILKEWANP